MCAFHGNFWAKGDTFWGASYLKAPSEEAQPTLGPWTEFEPVRLEIPRTPKRTWFHCNTAAPLFYRGRPLSMII
ncbi:hypothetical protein E2C01_071707 [Portunus trituberculatus]|uniref:Uncharacterized protein n=1 Tax=Portunus trituberculatus TaxID=210409 RepID=A0A5B7I5M3_PORTR|nr:hypothetical protein [Portunus trituberculatus]